MSEWSNIVWFTEQDINSTEKSQSDSGGSGVTPTISIITNYYVRLENNAILTDENGLAYSIEGL